jgi:indole-3-glycerol phosphate synthase
MTILEKILANKYHEVEERKSKYPVKILEKSNFFQRGNISLKQSLLREELFGIIAEFKRKSPSKGIMNEFALTGEVCLEYMQAGSSAVSVLTDSGFFGGSSTDLISARNYIDCPILQKDFIVDEYQIIEARSMGADAILLIAEVHQAERVEQLFRFARSLELEVLVEVHDEKSIPRIPYDAQLVGINSRNLKSFRVSLDHLTRLINHLPKNIVKVAESGIKSVTDYLNLKNAGFDAFLIGEFFMNTPDPGKACKAFISELRQFRALSDGTRQNFRQ